MGTNVSLWRLFNTLARALMDAISLWLKADLRSKCEFLNTSHLLIEGYILEIGHGKTEYSLTIYLTTKKISATSERAHAHRRQKRARAAVFAVFAY